MRDREYIYNRIASKKADYARYDFDKREDDAFKTFFDLTQEFDDIDDYYSLCVAIPKAFFGFDARLYLIESKLGHFGLVAATDESRELHSLPSPEVRPHDEPYYTKSRSLVLMIRGKKMLIDQLPFEVKDNILGLLEIYPAEHLDAHRQLFFEKYANRIGFNIHNRYLVEKNVEHLRFISTLVADIEHNIIAPNMVYKLFLKDLRRKVMRNVDAEKLINECMAAGCHASLMESVASELNEINRGLLGDLENLEKHYQNMTLFLETLLRRSHFDKGRLTIITKPCNVNKEVVQPQLERFLDRFQKMGIALDDRFSGIPDEEVISVVDVGLMAQVYANLFSNALKYTQEVVTGSGETKKYVAYGREVIPDYFEPGKDGVKYNVFNTGPHLPEEERLRVFEDGFRGANAQDKPGTGHGLTFVRNVIEIHGGVVGYEPTHLGNNFYFILPR